MSTNGETLADAIAAKAQAVAEERQIIAQANATPLPGALREAFSPQQDIKVGNHTVRPFYDGDFEILQMLDHPLARMANGGEQYGQTLKDCRGPNAWSICWLLTNPPDLVDEVSQNGAEAVQKASRKEFRQYDLGGLLEINKAVLTQFARYFSTVVQLEAAESEDGSKKA